MANEPTLTRWQDGSPPTEEAIQEAFRREGLSPHAWSNGPYFHYAAHSHAYHKVLYAVRGSITFVTHPDRRRYELGAGDRLDLPPGAEHSADVGADGVTCLEAPRFR